MGVLAFCRRLLAETRAARRGAGDRVWVIGPMPEPLNGQTNYNRRMVAELERHAAVTVLPTGGTGAEKIAAGLLLPLLVLFGVRRPDHVYTSPPGQNGVWLFLPVLLALRLRRKDHFLHHHSYRPINLGPTRAARALVAASGRYQRHVFLSERMRDAFARLYLSASQAARSLVLPNAFLFFEAPDGVPSRSGPVTIGHLSVITREKGVAYLTEIARPLLERRDDVRLVLAGPIRDGEFERELRAFCAAHPGRAEYRGPVYGDAKAAFYAEIDLFALPSRLVDEADPLVILEGYSAGCDVLASSTGCIPERLRSPDHLLTFDEARDVATLEAMIDAIAADRRGVAATCQRHVESLHARSIAQAKSFFHEIGADVSLVGGGPAGNASDPIPLTLGATLPP